MNMQRRVDYAVRLASIHKRRVGGVLIALLITALFVSSFKSIPSEYQDVSIITNKFTTQDSVPATNALGYLQSQKALPENAHIFTGASKEEALLDFDRDHLKVLYPEVINELYARTDLDTVDWSRYAYVFYATSDSHVCNVLMKFAELRQWESRAQFVMLVNKELLDEKKSPDVYKQLMDFADKYDVTYKPTEVIHMESNGIKTWVNSFTKLLVFNETDYERIVYMDSDALLPHSHLDELFFIPPCKLAVPNGYWLSKDKIQNNQNKYDPKEWGFKPMTTEQRQQKIDKLVAKLITPYVDETTEKLNVRSPLATRQEKINEKNFYTNVYNSMPNNPALDEFTLTNIVMVIQPSTELFERVTDAFEKRAEGEYDMDLVQDRIFPTKPTLKRQIAKSPAFASDMSFDDRLNEIPEMLVLPHQVYATLTLELNVEGSHVAYAADTHDEAFALYKDLDRDNFRYYFDIDKDRAWGDTIYQQSKYIHFSDSPIPKPWWKKNLKNDYMAARKRCPAHPDFDASDGRVKPAWTTEDCTAGLNWEKVHLTFAQLRSEVCGLKLQESDKNTYFDIVN